MLRQLGRPDKSLARHILARYAQWPYHECNKTRVRKELAVSGG